MRTRSIWDELAERKQRAHSTPNVPTPEPYASAEPDPTPVSQPIHLVHGDDRVSIAGVTLPLPGTMQITKVTLHISYEERSFPVVLSQSSVPDNMTFEQLSELALNRYRPAQLIDSKTLRWCEGDAVSYSLQRGQDDHACYQRLRVALLTYDDGRRTWLEASMACAASQRNVSHDLAAFDTWLDHATITMAC